MEISAAGGLNRLIAGRYRLTEPIGHGGMATVYRGQDEALGRDIAVKLFRASAVDPDDVGRQDTEMHLLASLTHPGLVTLFDAGKDDAGRDDGAAGEPRAFLVMELVDGPDLRRRLREHPVPAADVAFIGAELAGALAYIHARGIVHRDVKPANILLPPTIEGTAPRAKLTDFGIARMVDGARLTATGATLGTANYLSPEQASGSSACASSDIYSLGLVLLESVTGRIEFGGSAVEAAVARLSRDPEIPQTLGPQWRSLLGAMTARSPSERPTAAEVSASLLDYRWAAGITMRRELRENPPPAAAAETDTPTGTGVDTPVDAPLDKEADRGAVAPTDTPAPAHARVSDVNHAAAGPAQDAAEAIVAGAAAPGGAGSLGANPVPGADPAPGADSVPDADPGAGKDRVADADPVAGVDPPQALTAGDSFHAPDIHTPAAPPTPPSIGAVPPPGSGSRPAGNRRFRTRRRSARGTTRTLGLQQGYAVIAWRSLLALLAMTVLTVAVVLAAGRMGAASPGGSPLLPGQGGGSTSERAEQP